MKVEEKFAMFNDKLGSGFGVWEKKAVCAKVRMWERSLSIQEKYLFTVITCILLSVIVLVQLFQVIASKSIRYSSKALRDDVSFHINISLWGD